MNKVNYHTHSERCGHALGKEEEYVQKALESNLDILGFSDHLPFEADIYGMRMPYAELDEYIDTVFELKKKYKNEIEILCGFEGEYVKGKTAFYEKLLCEKHCDYLIMGQHFYEDAANNTINVYTIRNTEQYITYAKYAIEGMKSGYFNFWAHPDLIFINDLMWDDNCSQTCDMIIDAAMEHHFILEYNANGYRRGLQKFCDGIRYPYPHAKFWERVANSKVPVVISSDCHQPEQIFDVAMEKAYLDATELRLNIVSKIR